MGKSQFSRPDRGVRTSAGGEKSGFGTPHGQHEGLLQSAAVVVDATEAERTIPVAGSGHNGFVASKPVAYVARLHAELAAIRDDMDDLLDHSTIRNVNPNTPDSPVFFVDAADWGWSKSDAATSAMQMRLLARYSSWFNRFRLLFPHATPDIDEKIATADDFVRRWTARPNQWDHSVPPTIGQAKQRAGGRVRRFRAAAGRRRQDGRRRRTPCSGHGRADPQSGPSLVGPYRPMPDVRRTSASYRLGRARRAQGPRQESRAA